MACVVYGCKSHSSKKSAVKHGLTFHRFPQDENLSNIWVKAIHRQDWKPTQFSRICSKHFTDECYMEDRKRRLLRRCAIPTIFENYPTYIQKESTKLAKASFANVRRHICQSVRQTQVNIKVNRPFTPKQNFDLNTTREVQYLEDTPRIVKLQKSLAKQVKLSSSRLKKLRILQQKCRRFKHTILSLQNEFSMNCNWGTFNFHRMEQRHKLYNPQIIFRLSEIVNRARTFNNWQRPLAEMKDVIRVTPEHFHQSLTESITTLLNRKLANKVVLNVGLCIALFDIIDIGHSYIFPGDGSSHTEVKFRYIVFRPLIEEILIGKIRSCSRDGVQVTLGFFDDILIPVNALQHPSRFDETDQAWVWEYGAKNGEKHDLFMDSGEPIRFRVTSETFEESLPTGPPTSERVVQTVAPYRIIGGINEPGLGLLTWWEQPDGDDDDDDNEGEDQEVNE